MNDLFLVVQKIFNLGIACVPDNVWMLSIPILAAIMIVKVVKSL